MAKFHINPESGDAGSCQATQGKCPFGADSEHYESATEARAASEANLSASFGGTSTVLKKKTINNSLAFESKLLKTNTIENSSAWVTQAKVTAENAETAPNGSIIHSIEHFGGTSVLQKLEDGDWYSVGDSYDAESSIQAFSPRGVNKTDIQRHLNSSNSTAYLMKTP